MWCPTTPTCRTCSALLVPARRARVSPVARPSPPSSWRAAPGAVGDSRWSWSAPTIPQPAGSACRNPVVCGRASTTKVPLGAVAPGPFEETPSLTDERWTPASSTCHESRQDGWLGASIGTALARSMLEAALSPWLSATEASRQFGIARRSVAGMRRAGAAPGRRAAAPTLFSGVKGTWSTAQTVPGAGSTICKR